MSLTAPMSPPSNWEELFAQQATVNRALIDRHAELVDVIKDLRQPADMELVVINDSNNGNYRWESRGEATTPSRSIGILNPGSVPIFVGLGGLASNLASARAPSCPPESVLVLPVMATFVELGADPTVLGTDTAIAFLFRFHTVQRLSI